MGRGVGAVGCSGAGACTGPPRSDSLANPLAKPELRSRSGHRVCDRLQGNGHRLNRFGSVVDLVSRRQILGLIVCEPARPIRLAMTRI